MHPAIAELVIARAAKQSIFRAMVVEKIDCFAARAMTKMGRCARLIGLELLFLKKKEAKKLLLLRAVATTSPTPAENKSFLVTFFQKSNFLLSLA